jgi:peptidoglycan hydrolase-like protein with peptidoglycan-binding domain
MTIHLCAVGTRITRTAAIAALVLATVLLTPLAAQAAGRTTTTQLLAQGTGMKGAPSVRVRTIQRALRHRGYHLGPAGVDGRFGPDTAAAVGRLQARKGLAVDGIVGPSTRRALGVSRLRPAKKQARRSRGRAQRHHTQQTNDGASERPTRRPSTSAPATAPTATTAKPTAPSSTPATPASGPALEPATAPGHGGTTWGVPIGIAAIAMLLLVFSLPLFWEPKRPRRRTARRTAAAAAMAPRADHTDRTPATSAAAAAPVPSRAAAGRNRRENNGRRAGTRPSGAAGTAGTKQKASAVNGSSRDGGPPLARGDAVLGYLRVAEDRRAESIRAIRETCEGAGWNLVDIVCDGANGKSRQAAALNAVVERIAAGEVGGLVVGHDGQTGNSRNSGGALDLLPLAGPQFALHDLAVHAAGCDVALITLNGRHSLGGKRAVG